MESEEVKFSRIQAPGIMKKNKGKNKHDNPKVESILRRLAVLSNTLQKNSQSLDMLNCDLTMVEHFQDSLSEKFIKSTELVNIKLLGFKESQKNLSDQSESMESLNEKFLNLNEEIGNCEKLLEKICLEKEGAENEAEFVKENVIRLVMEEEALRSSIDYLRTQLTISLIEQNSLLRQKGEKTIVDVQEKFKAIEAAKERKNRREPQKQRVYKDESSQIWALLGLLSILIIIKLFYVYKGDEGN